MKPYGADNELIGTIDGLPVRIPFKQFHSWKGLIRAVRDHTEYRYELACDALTAEESGTAGRLSLVPVATAEGRYYTIPAAVGGAFAATFTDGRWSVTHIGTGLRVTTADSKGEACRLVEKLSDITDLSENCRDAVRERLAA